MVIFKSYVNKLPGGSPILGNLQKTTVIKLGNGEKLPRQFIGASHGIVGYTYLYPILCNIALLIGFITMWGPQDS